MYYKVKRWPGVAVRKVGYPKVFEPYRFIDTNEDGDEVEIETGEGEWIDDEHSGKVLVVMVGDDKEHTVDADDLVELPDDEFCRDCGQIGCGHNVYE